MGFFDRFLKKSDSGNVRKLKKESNEAEENQFECIQCKKILDKKYLHTNQTCIDCFSKNYTSEPYTNTESTTQNNLPNNIRTNDRYVNSFEYVRILNINLRGKERYFSIYLPTGQLCITDHTYAGGYGGGYLDYRDELIEFDISYNRLTEYVRSTSILLEKVFEGINSQNFKSYLEEFKLIPKHISLTEHCEALLGPFDEIEKIEVIDVYDYACVYICKVNKKYALVMEKIRPAYAGVQLWYLIIKKIDKNQALNGDKEQIKMTVRQILHME